MIQARIRKMYMSAILVLRCVTYVLCILLCTRYRTCRFYAGYVLQQQQVMFLSVVFAHRSPQWLPNFVESFANALWSPHWQIDCSSLLAFL